MKDKKRKIKYIPFGRLISDLLTQNGLIQDIRKTGITEDLTESIGDVMDGKNLDRMGVIDKLEVTPMSEDPKEILKQHFMCDGFPMFYDHEPKEVLADYIYWLGEQGENIEGFTVADVPKASSAELSSPPRVKAQKKKKVVAAAEEEPPKKKRKSEPKKRSEQSVALKTNPVPKSSRKSSRYQPPETSSESDTSSDNPGSTSSSPTPSPQPYPKPISPLPPQKETTPTPPESPLKLNRKLKIKTTFSKPPKSKPSIHSEIQKETTQNQPPKIISTSDQVPPAHQEEDSQPISQLQRPPPETNPPQEEDSEVTLSKYSDVNSSDLAFDDIPPTPYTKTIPQSDALHTQTPTSASHISEPSSPPSNSEQQNADKPSTPPSTPSFTAKDTSCEQLINEVVSSSVANSQPSSELVSHTFIPMDHSESLQYVYLAANQKGAHLKSSSEVIPMNVERDWYEYQEWLIAAGQHLLQTSQIEKVNCIKEAFKRQQEMKAEAIKKRQEEIRAEEERLGTIQREVADRERTVIEAAQADFLRQASEKLQAEEFARAEAERMAAE